MTLWRLSNYFVYDWSNYSFVKDQSVKNCFPLFLHTNYTPVGDTQLFTLTFDTSKIADGLYFLTYCAPDGTLYPGFVPEYFYVIGGSPDPIWPNQSG